jgi:hypothetical protein
MATLNATELGERDETTLKAVGHGSRGLQFGLQFTAVQRHPGRTDRGSWSSLNRSGRPRSELLMRLGLSSAGIGAATPPDGTGSGHIEASAKTQAMSKDRTDLDDLRHR